MSCYFRNLFAESGTKNKATKCAGCGCGVYGSERFCIFCGQENPKFSLKVFEDMAKCSLEEALSACKQDLPHKVESMAQALYKQRRPKKLRPPKYCSVCRQEIPPFEGII